MKVSSFQGLPNVQEVTCSGEELDPQVDLFNIALFTLKDIHVLSSANLKSRECTTSYEFASCEIDTKNVRKTKVTVLLVGLRDSEWRSFGCELTGVNPDGRSHITSWSMEITGTRK